MRQLNPLDRAISEADQILKSLFAPATSLRPHPDTEIADGDLSAAERKHAAGLMRVNHCGEICAQALYQGQAMTARSAENQVALRQAQQEEVEHLAWTAQRVHELGSHTSILNPLWYAGSLAIGVAAGLLGDKWNLGFLAETEEQVAAHLAEHLSDLPEQDTKSRAIVAQMRTDELQHRDTAHIHGAAALPFLVKQGMRLSSRIMTNLSYRL